MDIAYAFKGITGDRAVECVVRVRRYKRGVALKTNDDGRVIKIARCSAELHEIPDTKLRFGNLNGERTCAVSYPRALFVVYQKVVEIFHARPRRRPIVRRDIIPTQIGRIVLLGRACK